MHTWRQICFFSFPPAVYSIFIVFFQHWILFLSRHIKGFYYQTVKLFWTQNKLVSFWLQPQVSGYSSKSVLPTRRDKRVESSLVSLCYFQEIKIYCDIFKCSWRIVPRASWKCCEVKLFFGVFNSFYFQYRPIFRGLLEAVWRMNHSGIKSLNRRDQLVFCWH